VKSAPTGVKVHTLALPNLFLLGAPKAATTSLAQVLSTHPEVSLPAIKEPDFFSWDDEYRKGLAYFERTHFQGLDTRVRLDASVTYLASPDAAARISADLEPSHHRFIIVLRDPVDRTYSNYWECRSAGFERSTFEESIRDDEKRSGKFWAGRYPQSHLVASRYGTNFSRWLDVFHRDSFLILRFEDLKDRTHQSLRRIYEFAQVDPELGLDEIPLSNQAANPRWSAVSLVSRTPESVKVLARKILGQNLIHSTVGALDSVSISNRDVPPMDPETRAHLRQLLRSEVLLAENLTGIDLSDWR